ncbi:MAG: hypothetical protein E6Q97_30710 [Desulfurellales bacterium]|nr:MAG: hypothetical protein E6Q97_30710 [Desulfurellales bacterium]
MSADQGQSSDPMNSVVTLPNGRLAIELTDDVHQDEPSAYMVFMHNDTMEDYRVFARLQDARRCAEQQCEESGRDWLIYPLYPTHGIEW